MADLKRFEREFWHAEGRVLIANSFVCSGSKGKASHSTTSQPLWSILL